MTRTALLIAVAAAASFGLGGAALAQGNSESGEDRYDVISQNPNPDAQCGTGAGSGTFGYLGTNYNLGVNYRPDDPGANGYQTGLNNSAVCGSGNRPNENPS